MRLILAAASLGVAPAAAADSPATVEYLRCEYRVDPLGIDVPQPRLSWEMRDLRAAQDKRPTRCWWPARRKTGRQPGRSLG